MLILKKIYIFLNTVATLNFEIKNEKKRKKKMFSREDKLHIKNLLEFSH